MTRLAEGGRIDRSRQLWFRFDGRRLPGHPGDTLASALLANGVRLVGRSFKYHRPRGILTSGSEEPNALVEIGDGARRTPNTRATTQELYDGLVARSQNRWPSLALDLLEVNDLLSPFLSAGFYYKTFMWPRSFWERVYEPAIRRAAGLGRLSGLPDPDICDKAHAHCDLLVIGAGPAGLMAARLAGEAGARVILADEDFAPGGRLLAECEEIDGVGAADWAAETVAALRAMPNVRVMTRTTVTGAYDTGTYGALERVSDHLAAPPDGAPRLTFWRIAARRTILAAGATERPITFPGNDRPGVMLAGAVREYARRWAVAPGQRVAVFGNTDDAWRTATDLQAAGVAVTALIDVRADAAPPAGPWRTLTGAQVIATRGRLALREIVVRHPGGEARIPADCLAVSGGWNPNVHLTCHMNGRPVWDAAIQAFVPADGAVPGLRAAGAAQGDLTTAGALGSGLDGARRALDDLGIAAPPLVAPRAAGGATAIAPFWHVDAPGRAWLDFQNDVTVKDVALAHRENFRSVEHMKRYTTLGMATDQGKTANVGALAIMAALTDRTMPETGTTTFRPPFVPVEIAALGARAQGRGFQPIRLTPSHAAALAADAPMYEAGLWYRAAWYPEPAERTWRESCDREVAMVRGRVGISDVTTLGKIDVQGPDAAAFLDRVYTNTMSSLKPGRVRYGLMLREDGFVMDDGTCARLSETHFAVTTTTAAAGQVMAHLEFCAQCLWPDLDLRLISVTEAWAQFAVAGPAARELVQGVVAEDVTEESFPFMGCGAVTVAGVAGRLFRISFSGEHAYEIAVPARYGAALWDLLAGRARELGGGPYGLEALNVLRIEKGHLTHAELHGRTTADDLGMVRMIAARKDCIGKVMSQRPGLSGPAREQLVGLRPVDPDTPLRAGARFVARGAPRDRQHDQGYLTSVCWSPTLRTHIGLGFLTNGRARIGEIVEAVDFMRGGDTACHVVPLPFVDPGGEWLRG